MSDLHQTITYKFGHQRCFLMLDSGDFDEASLNEFCMQHNFLSTNAQEIGG